MPTDSSLQVDTICAGCRSSHLYEFFHTMRAPVNVGSLSRSREEALEAKVEEIRLVYCLNCELVHNPDFDYRKVDFRPGYEVALSHSKTFLDFQQGVVSNLVANHNLNNKDVLEIGCGDGVFLKMMCQAGGNRGVGIDPSVPQTGQQTLESGSVRFIRDYFDETYANEIGDFICCLSVFENIPSPLEFLVKLRNMIGDRNTGIYFEVFNGFRSIQAGEIWSIHYEQCNYFSPSSLASMFRLAGFKLTNWGTCYEQGQYAFVEATPDLNNDGSSGSSDSATGTKVEILPDLIREFAEEYRRRTDYWSQKLTELKRDGRRVVLWGCGGKGISFLNAVNVKDEIQYVVDINPNRQGSFIPGTAQEVINPDVLSEFQPDLIVLTNPIYEQEIRQQVEGLNLNPEFDYV